jgi:hypothetical protein
VCCKCYVVLIVGSIILDLGHCVYFIYSEKQVDRILMDKVDSQYNYCTIARISLTFIAIILTIYKSL